MFSFLKKAKFNILLPQEMLQVKSLSQLVVLEFLSVVSLCLIQRGYQSNVPFSYFLHIQDSEGGGEGVSCYERGKPGLKL